MSEYQPALGMVIASLVVIVPAALFLSWIMLSNMLYILRKDANRETPPLRWQGAKPTPEELVQHHEELIAMGFVMLGAYQKPLASINLDEWSYYHPDTPTIFVTISSIRTTKQANFITVFDGNEVIMTLHGYSIQLDNEQAIVNAVDGTLTQAYNYHQKIVESETARFGKPLPITTIEEFTKVIHVVLTQHFNAMFQTNRREGLIWFTLYSFVSAIIGATGLVLINTQRLDTSQANKLAMLLPALIVVGGIWIYLMPDRKKKSLSQKKKLAATK